jgi:integrase
LLLAFLVLDSPVYLCFRDAQNFAQKILKRLVLFRLRFRIHEIILTHTTNHLRDGVDIRTVQAWLGHSDIKSTMVYLKGIRSKDAAMKVNSGELASLVT